ncbi:protein DpdE [Streptomyces sp. NRRL F-5123]|uniref:protein DpdE n=1 Tax=Streptomyces sp. NRRL F-5123 TaxID=1463856 RepID=UPI0004E109CE|nr:protein DpdE [Streptomyces sp. NRRL F-5123]
MSGLRVGDFVYFSGSPGVGRVGADEGDNVRVDFFESIAEPVALQQRIAARSCTPVSLPEETRVYRRDPSTGVWIVGRVRGSAPGMYYVQFPNHPDVHLPVKAAELHVRWDKPVRNPVATLGAGGNESGYFHDARLPMLHSLIAQRSASGSIPALLSAAVEIYPHQVQAALTVLSDPVQRYLLSDEVGLGKTVQAGYVIRQTLIDDPRASVVIVTPQPLVRQWRSELLEKFFIDDFPDARITFTSHETPLEWETYRDVDLLVVDEAHLLVHDIVEPTQSPYRELCGIAHSAVRLLLLSATPVTSHYVTHLGLLHLLDKDLYRWDDRAAFEERYRRRKDLADGVFQLDSYFPALLPMTIKSLRELLPFDARFEDLAADVLALLTDDDELTDEDQAPELGLRVERLRAHLGETYRLHRRVIRHRRASVLQDDEGSDLVPYEVRGRTRPRLLAVDFEEHHLSQALLLEWRMLVTDDLMDAGGSNTQYAAFAMALAVLASRAGGLAEDLLRALRWRIHHDRSAADSAGLTEQERQLLAAPRTLPAESTLLETYTQQCANLPAATARSALAQLLAPVIRRGTKVVIFCGAGSLATQVATALGDAHASTTVVGLHTTATSADACERVVQAWRAPQAAGLCQVLVADTSAEDGLNLQVADTVVHMRLPWSPNRLEQRIGRVDRYRGVESLRQNRPAQQFRVGDREGNEMFSGAWAALLHEGYGLFTASVSTLQDIIAEGLTVVWRKALADGPAGLTTLAPDLRENLREAKRDIDRMDMLESIHETSEQARQTTSALDRLEQEWRTLREDLVHYADDSSGGLRFRHDIRTVAGHQRDRFDVASSRPLIDPRRHKAATDSIHPHMSQGVFNRSAALRAPGTRLFRAGNPFVDMLASIVFADERGQATAFRRFDPACRGADEAYFGLEYLVEADIDSALERVDDVPEARRALRRQADRLLAPFTRKIWVPAGQRGVLTNAKACAWLEAPYGKPGDQNYNFTNHQQLVAVFGGGPEYRRAAEAAQDVAHAHLVRATDLVSKCLHAQEQARQQLAVAAAQAQARQAAGHLLGDTESYLLDVAVAEELTEGLSHPSVRVVAATCIVRGGYRAVNHRG